MDKIRAYLLNLSRRQKRAIQVSTDVVLVWLALWLAFVVRLGIDEMVNPVKLHFWLFIAAPVVAIPFFIRFGMYRAVMRYFGNDALIAIIKAVSLSSASQRSTAPAITASMVSLSKLVDAVAADATFSSVY